MKEELEVKILEVDERAIRRRLRDLGAAELFDHVMTTASYDFSSPDGTPLWLTREDEAGRLLYVNNKLFLFHETLVTDHDGMRAILQEIGLERRQDAYLAPRKLSSLENEGKRLRLRTKGTYGELTLKKDVRKQDVKRALEYETRVHDHKACRQILLAFGMREGRRYEKRRVEYALGDGVKVAIDTLERIPAFIEIEGPTVRSIEQAVNALGYEMKDASTMSGRDLQRHYGAK